MMPQHLAGNLNGIGDEDGGAIAGTLTASDSADGLSNANFTVSANGANGVATIDATSGDWSYTPNTNFNGTDTFTVTITDDDNNVETQDITVTVNNVNDAATFGGNIAGSGDEDGGAIAGTRQPVTVQMVYLMRTLQSQSNGANGCNDRCN